jgi:hypothetical protein
MAASNVSRSRISPTRITSADFALVDDRLLVLEHELDRVFDCEDVYPLVLVDVLEHRRDCRALAATGHAREDDQALIELAQLLHDRRQEQLFEVGDLRIHAPGDQ